MKRLKMIMCVFGFSYVLRFAFDLAISFDMMKFSDMLTNYPGAT